MAAFSTLLAVAAIASVGVGAYSVYAQQQAAGKAQDQANKAADEQRKINAQARAREDAQAAQERRRQFREERVRRAMVIQSSENTGVSDSSGSLGAQGALATNLSSNLGFNQGEVERGSLIGGMMDVKSNFMSSAQNFMNQSSMWGSIGNFANSIFTNLGGVKAIRAGFKG